MKFSIINPTVLYFLSLICSLSTAPVSAQHKSTSYKEAKKSGTGSISLIYTETPYLIYKNGQGNPEGIALDIMKDFTEYVFNSRGITLDVKVIGSEEGYKNLTERIQGVPDGVFGLGNIPITDSLEKKIAFSPPIIKNKAVLITNTSVPEVDEFFNLSYNLKGFTAYAIEGSPNAERLRQLKKAQFPELKISYLPSNREIVDKIISDDQSFAYIDLFFYISELAAGQKSLKRHPIGDSPLENLGIILAKKSDWKPVLESFFRLQNGYTYSINYLKIISEHLGLLGIGFIDPLKHARFPMSEKTVKIP